MAGELAVMVLKEVLKRKLPETAPEDLDLLVSLLLEGRYEEAVEVVGGKLAGGGQA